MKGGTVQICWHEGTPILTLDFHPPSATLATAGADFEIKFWSVTPSGPEKKLPVVTYLNCVTYQRTAINVIRFSSSGELLASGLDGGDLIIWKLNSTDNSQIWKVLKMLRSHNKDILDLQWSADSSYIISGSVDNSCIIWDVNKGTYLQKLDAHAHYVQGVAWDPLGKYVASISSDRTCRIYMNKPHKSKGIEKLNYVCQQVISKAEQPLLQNSKSTKYHLFHDETLPSFFRRLAWSPDGSFLVVPAGSYKIGTASESVNAAYVFSRKDLSRPAIQLPCANKAVIAVRFCPISFKLRGTISGGLFKLPYRIIFAVATLNSLYIYDTESNPPIAVLAGLHYATITDITWSSDGHYLALSSQDGFCSLVEFENDELGTPYSDGKVSNKDSKSPLQTANDTVIVPSGNAGVVIAENRKTEAEEKADDVVVESAGNVQPAMVDGRKNEVEDKADVLSVEATGNVERVISDSRKNEAEEKAEKQGSSSGSVKCGAEEKAEKPQSSLDRVKSGPEAKAGTQSSSSTSTPTSNKPARKRITPIAIDP